MPSTKIIVITGPTSSGKSSLAVEVAKKFNGEIISADSRQVYRHLDLGSGKVEGIWNDNCSAFLYEDIPHHLIDFVDPQQEYNVSHFQKDCLKKIQEIAKKGKLPILCGGTGFWIQTTVYDQPLPPVQPNPDLRKKLAGLSPEKLLKKLQALDPQRAVTIDAQNPVRLIRAIEIATALGHVPRLDQKDFSRKRAGYDFLQIALVKDKELLEEKIHRRLEERFKAGMIEEVERLHTDLKLDWEKIQSFGLGYFWIPLFLQKKIKKSELFERVFMAERNYAKRQLTWLKRNPDIVQESDLKKILRLVKNFLS